MVNFKASIPGWLDAVKLEAEQHDDSFVNPHDDICGVPIRHLSLVDIARLSRMGNRLFSGKFPSFIEFCAFPKIKEDAVKFLVYQHWKPLNSGYRRFIPMVIICMYRRYKYNRLDIADVFLETVALIDVTYLDSLGASAGAAGGESLWAGVVGYIDLIASEYGWTDQYIINMPYRRLIQLVRRINNRKDPDFIVRPASDRIVARHNAEKNRS